MHQNCDFEPGEGDELVIERTGVKCWEGRSKLHYVADRSYFTLCNRNIREFDVEIPLVTNGNPIKHKKMCGHCRTAMKKLAKRGVKIRMLRLEEYDGDEYDH